MSTFSCLHNFKSESVVLLWRAMLRKMLIGHFKSHQQDSVAWTIFLLASNKHLSVFRCCSVTGEIVLYFMQLSYFRYRDWLNPNCRALPCFPRLAAPFPRSCLSSAARQRSPSLPGILSSFPSSPPRSPSVCVLLSWAAASSSFGSFPGFQSITTYHKRRVGSVILSLSRYLYA